MLHNPHNNSQYGIFSIKELYEKDVLEIWNNPLFHAIDFFDRGYAIQNQIIENSILFIGMNPSYAEKNPPSNKHEFYDNTQEGRVYKYFTKFQEIAKEIQLSWAHIDLLFLRETNQKNIKKLFKKDDDNTKAFLCQQLEIARKIIERSKPAIIVVANAYAKNHFGFKIEFDPMLGTYKVIENNTLENVPVFFTSMLTGQRALDLGSYERLIWHLKFVKEKMKIPNCQ